jgi:hypothetical protein
LKASKAFKRLAGEAEDAAKDDEEWDADDLAKEARLAKQLKQGKITKAEYQKHLFGDDEFTL